MPLARIRQPKHIRLPKGIRLNLAQKGRGKGINWVGRNEDGIDMWEGSWRGTPTWLTTLFKVLGISLLSLSAIFAATGLWQAVVGTAIGGTIHTFLGFVLFERLRYRFEGSLTEEEAADQLGIQPEEFRKLVEENNIRPMHIYNDQPVYNLSSFGDVGTLLRASTPPPERDQTLLQPAGNAPVGSDKVLLRPADEKLEGNLNACITAATEKREEQTISSSL